MARGRALRQRRRISGAGLDERLSPPIRAHPLLRVSRRAFRLYRPPYVEHERRLRRAGCCRAEARPTTFAGVSGVPPPSRPDTSLTEIGRGCPELP